jgi:hypothetical protein
MFSDLWFDKGLSGVRSWFLACGGRVKKEPGCWVPGLTGG